MFPKIRLVYLSLAVSVMLPLNSFGFDITSYYPSYLSKVINKTQAEIKFLNHNFGNQTAMQELNNEISGKKQHSNKRTNLQYSNTTNTVLQLSHQAAVSHKTAGSANATQLSAKTANSTAASNASANTPAPTQTSAVNQSVQAVNSTKSVSKNKPINGNVIITQKLVNFTNTTTINGSQSFLNNIKFLYDMGYLPFYPEKIDGNKVVWRWNVMLVPDQLARLTPQSSDNILYKGAVKAFLLQNNLQLNHNTDLYQLLKQAYEFGLVKAHKPFTWVLVDQEQPQRLKVWQNGIWVAESNCNTGVRHLTPDGNFLVYARYRNFTMSGRWPLNNRPYYDPDVPYVNFFDGGDAIHGFYRRSYGYPQSAGCVELPVNHAKRIYDLLYIGTVVTIIN